MLVSQFLADINRTFPCFAFTCHSTPISENRGRTLEPHQGSLGSVGTKFPSGGIGTVVVTQGLPSDRQRSSDPIHVNRNATSASARLLRNFGIANASTQH